MKSKGSVFVGMSGGVDSSVSAALLKRAGYDVTGVFIKVWQPDEESPSTSLRAGTGLKQSCSWKEDRLDAMRVAAVLDIPFLTLDLSKEYKKEVVDYMISEYKKGRTPNPDVMCNKEIKFGSFLKKALSLGADFVATGHYAQTKGGKLLVSKDTEKDQTYFLWTLTNEQLSKTLFPIGHLTKPEVRKLAKKFKLPIFDKKDSQGLCFIGKVDMKDFLKMFIKEKKGKVVNEKGEVIGIHDGATFYTIGQRHGFVINEKTTEETPYYIVKKDVSKNVLVVSHQKIDTENFSKEIILENINLTDALPSAVSARIRYRQGLKKCRAETLSKNKVKITFSETPDSPSAGQSVVLYKANQCLGGGVIY
jgi:tRNA-specific 2-thiouridylase